MFELIDTVVEQLYTSCPSNLLGVWKNWNSNSYAVQRAFLWVTIRYATYGDLTSCLDYDDGW